MIVARELRSGDRLIARWVMEQRHWLALKPEFLERIAEEAGVAVESLEWHEQFVRH